MTSDHKKEKEPTERARLFSHVRKKGGFRV